MLRMALEVCLPVIKKLSQILVGFMNFGGLDIEKYMYKINRWYGVLSAFVMKNPLYLFLEVEDDRSEKRRHKADLQGPCSCNEEASATRSTK